MNEKKAEAETPDAAAENSTAAGADGQETPQQQQFQLDDSDVVACYANFYRVSNTPEEVIIDFGLSPNLYNIQGTTVKVAQRVVLNHYTAKRLLTALSVSLQRHEQSFGVLETDVRKRVRTQ